MSDRTADPAGHSTGLASGSDRTEIGRSAQGLTAESISELARARFWAKIDKSAESGCWTWFASIDHGGYGSFRVGGRMHPAHRVMYALTHGAITPGLVIHHECHNRRCVNPAHLRQVTQYINIMESPGPAAAGVRARLDGMCVNGHVLAVTGSYRHGRGKSECSECARIRARTPKAERPGRPEPKQVHVAKPRPSVEERFWSKVDQASGDGCWLWTASRFRLGYGAFRLDGRNQTAHRVA
jgi:hypothetical protein